MKEEIAVTIENICKNFLLPHEKKTSLKSVFTSLFGGKTTFTQQHALDGINFEIKKGEFFGIVGRNGSGKSTLLKIIAGIYQPTKGNVKVNGKLVPFIELGVGFNPELTGRENVFLNGSILGFTRKQIQKNYKQIVEFAELEDFMDQKLANYSSGMQVRLAFACATKAEADILLIDEVLAVGDADFQRKCFDYFKKLKKENVTVVFVTHDMGAVREFCDRAILIDKTKLITIDDPEKIARKYTKLFTPDNNESDEKDKDIDATEERWGDKKALHQKVKIDLVDNQQNILLSFKVRSNKDILDPTYGFMISNEAKVSIMGTNTKIEQVKVKPLLAGQETTVSWKFPNIFNEGKYYVELVLLYNSLSEVADWWVNARHFSVINEKRTPYIVNPPIKFSGE